MGERREVKVVQRSWSRRSGLKNRQILEGSSDSSKLCLEKSQARSAFEAREGNPAA
jgi:hypothetical protein